MIKNIIANIPLYIGILLRLVADKFMTLGFRTHITLGTKAGVQLKKVNEQIEELKKMTKELKDKTPKVGRGESRLADIIRGNIDEQPSTKKPSTDS